MDDLPLACTVRNCGLPLTPAERSLSCPKGHSYDVARSGYVNLLQPQDRRSPQAGDSAAAVAARARLGEAGVGQHLVQALVDRISALAVTADAVVVDLGSGTGEMMAALARARPIRGIGIDLSTAAADYAARKTPTVAWVVANADRRLPLLDQSLDLVLSVNARRNPIECARVLRPNGFLLVAVPAADDLTELRTLVQGASPERSRMDGVMAEHVEDFVLRDRFSARQTRHLERPALLDLLQITYRGARGSAAGAIAALGALHVTLASDVVLFARTS